jgi:hypothetical protein
MKKPSLSSALSGSAGKATSGAAVAPAPALASAVLKSLPEAPAKKKQASRDGMKNLSVHVPPSVHKQLARLKLDTDQSQEELMRMALNLLFEFHKLPTIA